MISSWKKKVWVTGALVLALNLGTMSFLWYQARVQQESYRTLRSEDGFVLLESLSYLINQDLLQNSSVSKSTLDHLGHLTLYKDVKYLSLETQDAILFRSMPDMDPNALPAIWQDPDIMAGIFQGDPFSRESVLNGESYLEYNWPIFNGSVFWGMLRMGLSMDVVQGLLHTNNQNLFILIGFIILLDILVVYTLLLNRRLIWEEFKFKAIMDHIQDGVHIFDPEQVIYTNKPFKTLCGADWENLARSIKRDYETHSIGEKTILFLKNRLQRTSIVIAKDITMENIAEASREREKRMLSVGELSSAFAHEIRNPLNTISMLIQQVKMNPNADEMPQTMGIVLKEIDRLNRSVTEFIKISKMPQINLEEASLKELFREIEEFYETRLESQDVHLKTVGQASTIPVLMDRSQMKGVFINLIENALDAGAHHIQFQSDVEGQMVRVQVCDDGSGMEPDVLNRAFEIYFTTKDKGSGLGLPHVQRLVSAHGGFLQLDSQPGKGTCFQIFLPAKGVMP